MQTYLYISYYKYMYEYYTHTHTFVYLLIFSTNWKLTNTIDKLTSFRWLTEKKQVLIFAPKQCKLEADCEVHSNTHTHTQTYTHIYFARMNV